MFTCNDNPYFVGNYPSDADVKIESSMFLAKANISFDLPSDFLSSKEFHILCGENTGLFDKDFYL